MTSYRVCTYSLKQTWKKVQCSSDPEFAFSNVPQKCVKTMEILTVHYAVHYRQRIIFQLGNILKICFIYFIIPWQHVLSCMNMAVDRVVHTCWNRLFMVWWTNRLEQRCWNHHDKSTTMFKLASSTMFMPVNRQK